MAFGATPSFCEYHLNQREDEMEASFITTGFKLCVRFFLITGLLVMCLNSPASASEPEPPVKRTSLDGLAVGAASSLQAAPYLSTVETPRNNPLINPDYDRSYDQYTELGPTGLVHPGVLHSREDLNTMRDMVWLDKEPWASAFENFRTNEFSRKQVRIFGGSLASFCCSVIDERYNLAGGHQMRLDATTAHQQAIMWYITGDEEHLNNAKLILEVWAKGLKQYYDRSEPAAWDDVSEIWGAEMVLSAGIAGLKFAAAAEILLYTPSSGWLRDDEGHIVAAEKKVYDDFFGRIWQETNKWYGFLNQASTGNMGYMAISVFLDDLNGYNESVERFAYNRKAVEGYKEGDNSINFSVAAMILDHGQIVEMGRDQPHSGVGIGALGAAARTIYLQGTKLNPLTGAPSGEGVDPYEFQNQKLLKMISYYTRYNVGFDVDFVPNRNGLGQRTEYGSVSPYHRGADDPVIASIYNHYKYVKGYEGEAYEELYKYPEIMMSVSYPEKYSVDFPGYGQLFFTPASAAWEEGETETNSPVIGKARTAQGSDYLTDMLGNAARSGTDALLPTDGAAVVYRYVQLGAPANQKALMTLRVKSDKPAVVSAYDLNSYTPGDNVIASFEVPDTEGRFVTLVYDLSRSGYGERNDWTMLRLTVEGEPGGAVQIDYLSFENAGLELPDLLRDVVISSNRPGQPQRAAAGDTVTIAFRSEETIENVAAYWAGQRMTLEQREGGLWTATYTLGEIEPLGQAAFRIDYDAAGGPGQSVSASTDGSFVTVVHEEGLLNDVLRFLPVVDSTPGRDAATTDQNVGRLFDRDAGSVSDFRTGPSSAWGSNVVFDMGERDRIKLSYVKLLAGQDIPSRASGVVVQGSNDATLQSWTNLTDAAAGVKQWQTLQARTEDTFRYIRIYNSGNWFGNLAEIKFYGAVEGPDRLTPVESMVTASSPSWDQSADAGSNGWRAFDGNPATSPDTMTSDGWVQIDLGSGNARGIAAVKFLPRANQLARMSGAVLEGSRDGSGFELIYAFEAGTRLQWYEVAVANHQPYRYLRYRGGHANVAELVLYTYEDDSEEVDLTELNELIGEARKAANDARVHQSLWGHYRQSQVNALLGAVLAAEATAARPELASPDILAARNALSAALDAFFASENREAGVADLGLAVLCLGTTASDPDWRFAKLYDLNGSGVVDEDDLHALAKVILGYID
jgi:hypothetical protein